MVTKQVGEFNGKIARQLTLQYMRSKKRKEDDYNNILKNHCFSLSENSFRLNEESYIIYKQKEKQYFSGISDLNFDFSNKINDIICMDSLLTASAIYDAILDNCKKSGRCYQIKNNLKIIQGKKFFKLLSLNKEYEGKGECDIHECC